MAAYRGAPDVVAKLLAVAPGLVNERDRLGRSPADLACLQKPSLAASSIPGQSTAVQKYADDDWMEEVHALLLNAGAEPCVAEKTDLEAGINNEKTQKTNRKRLSKKAQKALKALEWSPTRWGPSAMLPEGLTADHCMFQSQNAICCRFDYWDEKQNCL